MSMRLPDFTRFVMHCKKKKKKRSSDDGMDLCGILHHVLHFEMFLNDDISISKLTKSHATFLMRNI